MIKLRIVTHGDIVGAVVEDETELDAALARAAGKARAKRRPQLIELRPRKGYSLSLVVGADDTYLVFGGKGRRPMYCHSRGSVDDMEPYYLSFQGPHELSTPRRLIIPMSEGMRAVKEFIADGQRPGCITWEEMVL